MDIHRGNAIYKAQKMLKVGLEYTDEAIVNAKIRGDFFMHPEENLEKLEAQLAGCPLQREAVEGRIAMFLRTTQAFGFDEKSLAEAILQAAGKTPAPNP